MLVACTQKGPFDIKPNDPKGREPQALKLESFKVQFSDQSKKLKKLKKH